MELCLTIDDSPSTSFRDKVDFIYKKKIPALFFCIGNKIKKDEESIYYALSKGFLIGNHSYSHKRFSKLSLKQALFEIKKTDDILISVFKKYRVPYTKKFFRFPYGDQGDYKFGFSLLDFEEAFIKGYNKVLSKVFILLNSSLKFVIKAYQRKGIERKKIIQSFLQRSDYRNTYLDIIQARYNNIKEDYDWSWNFDTMDWLKQRSDTVHRKFIFERLSHNNPMDPRGEVNDNYTINSEGTHIILLHDFNDNLDTFKELIIRLEKLNFRFICPK